MQESLKNTSNSAEKKNLMDFIKLQELPKASASFSHSADSRAFKSYKVRATHECGAGSDVAAVCFSPSSESSELAVACGSNIQLCGVEFGAIEQKVNWAKHKNIVTCLAYRRDGKLLIAGDADGNANIYDVSVSKSILRRLRGHDGKITCAVFVPDNTRVVTAGEDQTVKIWDVPSAQVVSSLHGSRGHTDSVKCLVSVGESGVVSAGADGKLIYWDIRPLGGGSSITAYHNSPIEQLALFPSGALLFSFGGGEVCLWDIRTMTLVTPAMPSKHTKPITGAVVSDCGDFVVTSSFDQTVKVTRISGWEVVASFASSVPVTALAWRGSDLVFGLENGSIQLRQRRGEIKEVLPVLTSTARYYKSQTEDVAASKESNVNFMLRKFEYRKLMDFLIHSTPKNRLAIAIIDELDQRGGLEIALRDRPVDELTQIFAWCTRNLTLDISLIKRVVDVTVHTNARFMTSSPILSNTLKALSGKLGTEATVHLKAFSTIGLIEAIIS